MSRRTEPSTEAHPTSADFDRLRAGLLDGEPAAREALEAHLRQCAACRQRAGWWARVTETLAEDLPGPVAADLGARRRRALHGGVIAARRGRAPLALALTATVAALAIGLGVTVFDEHNRGDVAMRTTLHEQAPDFYGDIDFYLWLMERQANGDVTPNG